VSLHNVMIGVWCVMTAGKIIVPLFLFLIRPYIHTLCWTHLTPVSNHRLI